MHCYVSLIQEYCAAIVHKRCRIQVVSFGDAELVVRWYDDDSKGCSSLRNIFCKLSLSVCCDLMQQKWTIVQKNSSKDIILWPRFLWDHGAQVPLVHIPWIRPLSNNPKVCHLVLQVIVSIDLHWKQSCTATYISWDSRRKNHVIKCLSWNGLYLEIKVQNC